MLIIRFLFLFPVSLLYQLLFFINKFYQKKNQIQRSFVLSVGNLSFGGTGKTPTIIYISKLIQEMYPELDLIILSRGYKGEKSKEGMIVEIHSDPNDCGDEPLVMKQSLPYVQVIIGKNRLDAFQKFYIPIKKQKFILLDDGFQHFSINRNLDIVLIDYHSLKKKSIQIFPLGLYREGLNALKRAQILIITKITKNELAIMEKFEKSIKSINPNLLVFKSEFLNSSLTNVKNFQIPIESIAQKDILVFTGIGNSEYFFQMIESFKPRKLKKIQFPDHYNFQIKNLESLGIDYKNYPIVVCTEKDFIKLSNPPENIYKANLELKFDHESNFKKAINDSFLKFQDETKI